MLNVRMLNIRSYKPNPTLVTQIFVALVTRLFLLGYKRLSPPCGDCSNQLSAWSCASTTNFALLFFFVLSSHFLAYILQYELILLKLMEVGHMHGAQVGPQVGSQVGCMAWVGMHGYGDIRRDMRRSHGLDAFHRQGDIDRGHV